MSEIVYIGMTATKSSSTIVINRMGSNPSEQHFINDRLAPEFFLDLQELIEKYKKLGIDKK